MFIIFGWNHPTETHFGPAFPMRCPRCNNEVFFHLHRIKLWFTLFFIPVIPYQSKYYLSCEICGCGKELEGEDLEIAKKLNVATMALLEQRISKEEYITALNDCSTEHENRHLN